MTRGLVDTRTRARQAIIEGKIAVDGEVQLRPGVRVDPGALISVVSPLMHYVSRGALKLQAALDGFGIAVAGRVALDVGASTGGFTQLLLERGAARVYAVDVGRGQLHDILRSDPRVVAMEDTDIRQLRVEVLSPRPSLVTVDVSFISLRLVLPSICRLARDGSDVVALVKPQFEVGPGGVGKGASSATRSAAKMRWSKCLRQPKALVTPCGAGWTPHPRRRRQSRVPRPSGQPDVRRAG